MASVSNPWYRGLRPRSTLPGAEGFGGIADAIGGLLASQETPAQAQERAQEAALAGMRLQLMREQIAGQQADRKRSEQELGYKSRIYDAQAGLYGAERDKTLSEKALKDLELSGRKGASGAITGGKSAAEIIGQMVLSGDTKGIESVQRGLLAGNANASAADLFRTRSAWGDNLGPNSAVALDQQGVLRRENAANDYRKTMDEQRLENSGALDRARLDAQNRIAIEDFKARHGNISLDPDEMVVRPDGSVLRGAPTEKTLLGAALDRRARGEALRPGDEDLIRAHIAAQEKNYGLPQMAQKSVSPKQAADIDALAREMFPGTPSESDWAEIKDNMDRDMNGRARTAAAAADYAQRRFGNPSEAAQAYLNAMGVVPGKTTYGEDWWKLGLGSDYARGLGEPVLPEGYASQPTPNAPPGLPPMSGSSENAPAMVRTKEERDALPSGALYVGPDGQIRRKK